MAVCVHALQMCVCASDVCAWLQMCLQKTSHTGVTVPPTIPSIFYARLVPLGSPYIES